MSDYREKMILYLADELEPGERESLERRIEADEDLARELAELRQLLQFADETQPPEPPAAYWRGFWSRLEPKLKRESLWSRFVSVFVPRHGLQLATGFAAMGLLLIVALVLLYQVMVPQSEKPTITTTSIKIERTEGYFEYVADEHLERSRLLLQEVVNIASSGPLTAERLTDNRRRSEELLSENRTYRQAAERHNDERLAGLLRELELVLMDIANIDPNVAQDALANLQSRIVKKDLLERIKIVNLTERQPERSSDREVM